MTKPHSGDAEDKSDQPEGESAAVWAQTDAATEQKTAKAEKTGPVGGESKELDDTDDPAGSQDAGEADPATADDADDKNAERGEPAKAKSRISRARSTTGGRRRSSPPRVPGKTKPNTDDVDDASSAGDEELIDGEAKATADASATAGEDDGAGAKAPTSDEAKAEVDAEGDEPAKAKSRISRARSTTGGRRRSSPPRVPGKTKPNTDDVDDASSAGDEELIDGEAKATADASATAGEDDGGGAKAPTSDEAKAEVDAEGDEPAKAKSRISRARSTTGGRRRSSPPRVPGKTKPNTDDVDDASSAGDEELIDGEAKATADASATAGEDDGGGAKAPTSDEAKAEVDAEGDEPAKAKSRISWARVLAYAVLPALTLLLVPAAAFLKWHDSVARGSQVARIESVAAAKDATIALLSYKADTVEKDLEAAKTGLTGTFKESYSQLINEVVIPGAKKGHISATATVPAAASVSATPDHAVTLLFVNQTAVVDKDPPSDTTSSVRVTLDKVGGRWLISGFDPV